MRFVYFRVNWLAGVCWWLLYWRCWLASHVGLLQWELPPTRALSLHECLRVTFAGHRQKKLWQATFLFCFAPKSRAFVTRSPVCASLSPFSHSFQHVRWHFMQFLYSLHHQHHISSLIYHSPNWQCHNSFLTFDVQFFPLLLCVWVFVSKGEKKLARQAGSSRIFR